MSTRAAVGVGNHKSWQGIYNHFDGYPSGLGADAWRVMQNYLSDDQVDANRFKEDYIDSHKAGWSQFAEECYCHDRGETETDMRIDQDSADPLFLEWVYLLDPENETLLILSSEVGGSDPPPNAKDYGHCWARHNLVGVYPLRGNEPDWEFITNELREAADASSLLGI
jgi:hypothetical protein